MISLLLKCFLILSLLATYLQSAAAAPTQQEPNSNRSITWVDCSPDSSTTLKCANFSVPLDWSKPNGQQINLAIGMIPVANASQRIGYLLTNPGGPAGADIGPDGSGDLGLGHTGEFWRASEHHQYFDIVGPDPRGVVLSTPLECDPELWTAASHLSTFPQSEEAYAQLVDAWVAAGNSCLERSGGRLNFVDTASVAKDFESIRLALGDEPMNFLGFSYGTQLGAQYAELYPDNIRAMVLDGNLDHTQDGIYAFETESAGYEATLDQFFTWCSQNTSCAFHNTSDFPTVFDNIIDAAIQSPIPAPQCQNASSRFYPCKPTVDGYDILIAFQAVLTLPSAYNGMGAPGWEVLSSILYNAIQENDGSFFGHFTATTTSPFDSDYPYTAIECQDWNYPSMSWSQYQDMMRMGRIISPHTRGQGEFWRFQARCMNWPAPVTNPPHSIAPTFENRTLKTPVLLTNAFYDPETAYPWAVSLQRQFGDENAVLVSRNGSGHTNWYYIGEMHHAINDYLIDLKVPAHGTVLQS